MEFIFLVSQYDQNDLEEQLSRALEKQTELNSRKQLPSFWRFIDHHNKSRVSESKLRRRNIRYKIYGIAILAMGIFLLVPGLLEPTKLRIPLITGVIAVVTGLACLWPWRKRSNARFRKGAIKLLSSLQSFEQTKNAPVLARFAPEGMILPNATVISYSDFNTLIETESIYFLVWNGRVTVLQKRDLIEGTLKDFLFFLEEKTGLKTCELVRG